MLYVITHAIIATVTESSARKRCAQYAEGQVAEIKSIYLGSLKEEIKIYGVSIVFLNIPYTKDTPENNF